MAVSSFPTGPQLSRARRWTLLFTVAAGLLLVTLDNSVLYTALPTLTRELHASASQALWIINAYPLVMAGLLLGAGTLGDRIGHRRMFLCGLVLFGIASLAAAFSATAAQLIGARAFLAVGAAAMMPATLALIGLTFHEARERNIAIAIWGSVAIVGAALGPIIGGWLLAHFWWGSVFLVNVPVVVAAFIATWMLAPQGQRDDRRPWDLVSSLLALVALSGLVLAIKSLVATPPAYGTGAVALLLALAGGAAFLRCQQRLPHPLLDVAIFRNPAFLSGTLSAVFTLFAMAGLQLVTTQRFQLVAGFTPLQAGLLVSVAALGSLPSALLGGSILHRVGLRPLISGGLGLGAVGVAMVGLGFADSLGWVVAGMALTGLGMGAAISVASTAILNNVPPHRAGMASSVEEVSYEFGGLLAVALLGSLSAALYAAFLPATADIPAVAREGFTQAALAAQDGGAGTWFGHAAAAYDRAYQIVLLAIAAVLAAGATLIGQLLRGPVGGREGAAVRAH
ncbi:MFS transporter [Stenotrophomonas sp. 24(2023)]|uniref:MFS transporter n=1 Tax=Stenotrophomonas sp. 24(2023) TaxID=3068324 RepID=UPI0027E00ECB|nr:MFS transporter [Stenotrophomonas sp. 24(2023)]WMJ69325.1 MFS transporter [Stenotrophomonas sp. 24(2023)]